MILVTIGASEPFDRLVEAAGRLPGNEEVLIQCGASSIEPARGRCVDFMSFDELAERIRQARVVVMHAGAGSVLAALAEGKVPVVVPRRRKFGEAVDDHQVWFGQRLARTGLVRLVEDPARLAATLASHEPATVPQRESSRLVTEVRRYLDSVIMPTGSLEGAA
jgi:UDP-N-acetylglucosamine transferase subunit ALG13